MFAQTRPRWPRWAHGRCRWERSPRRCDSRTTPSDAPARERSDLCQICTDTERAEAGTRSQHWETITALGHDHSTRVQTCRAGAEPRRALAASAGPGTAARTCCQRLTTKGWRFCAALRSVLFLTKNWKQVLQPPLLPTAAVKLLHRSRFLCFNISKTWIS